MARKPKSSPLLSWDIYRAAAKAKWIGTVQATEADTAIREAAKEYKVQDPKRLIAVRRDTRAR